MHRDARVEVRLQEDILRVLREMYAEVREIKGSLLKLLHPSRTTQVKIIFKGEVDMAAITGNGAVGQTIVATVVPLEADGVTITPGAVVSGQVWAASDTTLATQIDNPDGSASYKLLLAGTDTITVNCTVTDQDGTVGTFSATNSFTIVVPTGRTASVQINFAAAA